MEREGRLCPEFDDAIWNDKVKIGDIIGPIKTQFGYHIIQIEGREMRPLSEAEKQQVYETAFNQWLDQQRKEKNIQTYDAVWMNNVPDKPNLADFGLPDASGVIGAPSTFPSAVPPG